MRCLFLVSNETVASPFNSVHFITGGFQYEYRFITRLRLWCSGEKRRMLFSWVEILLMLPIPCVQVRSRFFSASYSSTAIRTAFFILLLGAQNYKALSRRGAVWRSTCWFYAAKVNIHFNTNSLKIVMNDSRYVMYLLKTWPISWTSSNKRLKLSLWIMKFVFIYSSLFFAGL